MRLLKKITQIIPIMIVIMILASACIGREPELRTSPDEVTLRVGSKDFTEEFIIAEMYAYLLENAGFNVERKFNLGGTPVAHAAILNNDIDLYPEYTSTGLITVLKMPPITDSEQIIETVRSEYKAQFRLTWLEPAPFNNAQALAMTRERSETLGITTFSDLAVQASDLILGGPAEFMEREDGLRALHDTYGGFQFREVIQLGTGSLRYQALLDGQIDVVVAFGTDGEIQGYDLVRLVDDKNLYPVYQVAPVVRQDVLDRHTQIAEALNPLAPLLTNEVMSGLNWQVDGPENKEPADVAHTFLEQNGLLD